MLDRPVRRFGNETLGPGKDRFSRLQGFLVVLQARILADARIAPGDCVGSEPLRLEYFERQIQADCCHQVQQLGEVVSSRKTLAARDQDGLERLLSWATRRRCSMADLTTRTSRSLSGPISPRAAEPNRMIRSGLATSRLVLTNVIAEADLDTKEVTLL